MSDIAIVMLVVSMATVWGGLAWSIINLKRHPEE